MSQERTRRLRTQYVIRAAILVVTPTERARFPASGGSLGAARAAWVKNAPCGYDTQEKAGILPVWGLRVGRIFFGLGSAWDGRVLGLQSFI